MAPVWNLVDVADAAADCEWDEHLLRHTRHHVQHCAALLVGCVDVQQYQLVRACLIVAHRGFHRVARVADIHEVHALDHPTVADVQTGDDALGQHDLSPFHCANRRSIFSPTSPDFSG